MNELVALKETVKPVITVKPVNGQILIRKELKNFPILAITNDKLPTVMGEVTITVMDSSVPAYKKGDEILYDQHTQFNKVFDTEIDNPNDYNKIQDLLKSLKNRELEQVMIKTNTVTVVEYLLMHHGSIIAITNYASKIADTITDIITGDKVNTTV